MSNQAMNRAQRRQEARRQSAPKISFWKTNAAVAIIGIGIVALIIGGLAAYRATQTPEVPLPAAATAPTEQPAATPPVDPAAGLKTEDLKVGTGQEAKTGDTVTVHYTGTLNDGTKFDSSVDRGQPFTFTLGSGQVIRGWDLGVAGMKEGGKRKLVIPPSLGYGATPKGKIPPNSVLNFEVELLDVKSPGETSTTPAAPAEAKTDAGK